MIVRQGTSSLTVKVESWAKRRETDTKEKVTEGYFTFVAIDKNHRPAEIKTRRSANLNRKVPGTARRANINITENSGSGSLKNAEPILRVIPEPKDTNYLGDIFGGWILAHMDRACAKAAENFSGKRAATVGLEAMTFNRPVFVGDEVSFHTQVCGTGNTSVSVRVETWARRRMTGLEEKVTEGVFTYVCLGRNNKPVSAGSAFRRRK
ncbi:MAG: acyl-CoA thioesterase [Proteobacteria bacterium]|nr:acyl-CoA thioesterase [Pseudomonadota bacterium]